MPAALTEKSANMNSHHARRLIPAAVLALMGVVLMMTLCGCSDGENTTTSGQTSTAPALESGSIVVDGLVDYPMTLTPLDLDYMDWFTGEAEHPDQGAVQFEGVRLSDIFWYVGVRSEAQTLTIRSADGSPVDIALEDITNENAALAIAENGAFDVVVPRLEGDTWVADIVAMEFK